MSEKKTLEGKVVGLSDKTCVVEYARHVKHPLIKKYVLKKRKYSVHDPESRAKQGDYVSFASCRKVSKRKAFELVSIIREGGMS